MAILDDSKDSVTITLTPEEKAVYYRAKANEPAAPGQFSPFIFSAAQVAQVVESWIRQQAQRFTDDDKTVLYTKYNKLDAVAKDRVDIELAAVADIALIP